MEQKGRKMEEGMAVEEAQGQVREKKHLCHLSSIVTHIKILWFLVLNDMFFYV